MPSACWTRTRPCRSQSSPERCGRPVRSDIHTPWDCSHDSTENIPFGDIEQISVVDSLLGRSSRSGLAGARRPPSTPYPHSMIERAPFGATGHESSRVIFGAAALGDVSKADADRALELLLEHGINHIDVAASYGDAELRIANWLKRARLLRRHQDRRAHLRRRPRADPPLARPARRRPRRPDPAAQPGRRDRVGHRAQPRRRAGGVPRGARRGPGALHRRHRPRALSVPKMHERSLARYAFDSVLCPYNRVQMQDPRYAETFDELAAICQERDVALQTIKSLAYRPWEGREHTAATWYEPLTDQERHRPGRELGARQPAGLPAHDRRRGRAAEAARRRRAARRAADRRGDGRAGLRAAVHVAEQSRSVRSRVARSNGFSRNALPAGRLPRSRDGVGGVARDEQRRAARARRRAGRASSGPGMSGMITSVTSAVDRARARRASASASLGRAAAQHAVARAARAPARAARARPPRPRTRAASRRRRAAARSPALGHRPRRRVRLGGRQQDT